MFGRGELGRLILDTLRSANGKPLRVPEIVAAIIKAGGHGESARARCGAECEGTSPTLSGAGRSERADLEKMRGGRSEYHFNFFHFSVS